MGYEACIKFLAQITSFGDGGFLVLGCFSHAFSFLWLFFLFAFGLKLTSFGIGQLVQSIDPRNGFSFPKGFDLAFNSNKIVSFKDNHDSDTEDEHLKQNADAVDDDDDDDETELYGEDEEFDVVALRRLVRIERQRKRAAEMEVEKERMAASSAANEAMAMILRLQNEISSLEIEASQYRRMAEHNEEYVRQVIQSLQWMITKHESERRLLEEKLRICRQKLERHGIGEIGSRSEDYGFGGME
ncbi:Myosin-binding protein 3 [Linum grandiflorum]